jgi:hypothetical protein
MVEYNPRGKLPKVVDMTEEENYKMKVVLDTLFRMITQGSNLSDIQRYANGASIALKWPFTRHTPLEMKGDDEE